MTRRDVITWAAIAALGGLSAWLGVWVGHRVMTPAEQPPPPGLVEVQPGQALPALTLADLRSGEPAALSAPGRPRLINYWASWCGPCREEMPVLDAFAASQGDNGVEVVGIAMESREDALAFLAEVPVGFRLLVESPGPRDSSVQLGNRRGILPFTALVDAQGRLVKTHYGAFPDVAAVEAWTRP